MLLLLPINILIKAVAPVIRALVTDTVATMYISVIILVLQMKWQKDWTAIFLQL